MWFEIGEASGIVLSLAKLNSWTIRDERCHVKPAISNLPCSNERNHAPSAGESDDGWKCSRRFQPNSFISIAGDSIAAIVWPKAKNAFSANAVSYSPHGHYRKSNCWNWRQKIWYTICSRSIFRRLDVWVSGIKLRGIRSLKHRDCLYLRDSHKR